MNKESMLAFKLGFEAFVKEALYFSLDPKTKALGQKRLAAKAAPAPVPAKAPIAARPPTAIRPPVSKATQIHGIMNPVKRAVVPKVNPDAAAFAGRQAALKAKQEAAKRAAGAIRAKTSTGLVGGVQKTTKALGKGFGAIGGATERVAKAGGGLLSRLAKKVIRKGK